MDTIPFHRDDVPPPLDANLSHSRAQQNPRHDTPPPLRASPRPCAPYSPPAQHAEHHRLTEVRPEDGREREQKVVGRTGAPQTLQQGAVAQPGVEVAVVEHLEAGEQEVGQRGRAVVRL